MFVEDVTYIADEVGKKLVGGEITGAIRTEDDDYPSWGIRVKPPERALALLDAAGITRALVSSTPDDGTLALYRATKPAVPSAVNVTP